MQSKKRTEPVHDDIRERHRKRQLKKKRVRFTIFCFLMAFILLLAACAVVFLTPWFHVSAVAVTGNVQVQTADVVRASEIKTGENIFSVSLKEVEARLAKVAYVKSATVKRKLPDKIEIAITESHAVGCFQSQNTFVCFDETGKIVSTAAQPPEGVMTVEGLEAVKCTVGERIQVKNAQKLDTLLSLIAAAETNGCFTGIRSVDITKAEEVRFTYGQGLYVICGDLYDINRKLLTFMEVVKELPDNAKGEIDLRISSKAYYRP